MRILQFRAQTRILVFHIIYWRVRSARQVTSTGARLWSRQSSGTQLAGTLNWDTASHIGQRCPGTQCCTITRYTPLVKLKRRKNSSALCNTKSCYFSVVCIANMRLPVPREQTLFQKYSLQITSTSDFMFYISILIVIHFTTVAFNNYVLP